MPISHVMLGQWHGLEKEKTAGIVGSGQVNIHHGLELKPSQFLSVLGCFKYQIPSCFFERSRHIEILFHFVLEGASGWKSG